MTLGERGDSGDRGIAGERGPKGDHGQDGRTGMRGREGGPGPAGPIGKTGPTHPYLGRTQTLIIFAFIVVGFVLLAYRTELATNRIDQNVYEGCLARAEISRLAGNEPGQDCEQLQ